ncbi:MAG: hypothetical protein KID00_07470 [Clostridium argentinense]|uniref:hypothetical protein n=1 Tax=Clostridium butanoliproducens TaxID=2991837 RepID=UPI001D3E9C7A|nr:hypothetical protein [Clostridium butanoliproducens]MBS5823689.1 hypothetical protein [Clostridium argentinense]
MGKKIISIVLSGVLMLGFFSTNVTVNKNLESGKTQNQIQLKLLIESDPNPW